MEISHDWKVLWSARPGCSEKHGGYFPSVAYTARGQNNKRIAQSNRTERPVSSILRIVEKNYAFADARFFHNKAAKLIPSKSA